MRPDQPRVAHVSAGIGTDHHPPPLAKYLPQHGVQLETFLFTEANFPARSKSLSPRMAAKIPKMFMWDLKPGYDFYLWTDAALTFRSPNTAKFFVDQLGDDYDIVVFTHWSPSAHAEAESLRRELAKGCAYVGPRYTDEDLEGEMKAIEADRDFADNAMWCGGTFCYRPIPQIKAAMKEWWYRTTRFHCCDQFAFPHVLKDCRVKVLHLDIYKNDYLRWIRPLNKSCSQVTQRWLPPMPVGGQSRPSVVPEAEMIPAFVVHQSSNAEREPIVADLERKVPGLERVEALMHANGIVGCSRSHKRIIQRAKDAGWPAVWIMEDDCVFTPHFDLQDWTQTVHQALDAGYHIVVGGSANGQTPSKSPIQHLVTVQGFSSCHCWVLRADGYDAVLNVNDTLPIDVAVSQLALTKACRVPLIARQQPSLSSIQHIFEDYTILFDQAERNMLPFVKK